MSGGISVSSLPRSSLATDPNTSMKSFMFHSIDSPLPPSSAVHPKSKMVLQLPKYRNKEELDVVHKKLKAFSIIVFTSEVCHLEDHLTDVAMGKDFLLQGRDCAKSFKEFNANNIMDTFRILL
ncbi:Phospho-2-dehydro-3-deoxyheptonate aldolase 2, chloroplastic [Asimina triloba]